MKRSCTRVGSSRHVGKRRPRAKRSIRWATRAPQRLKDVKKAQAEPVHDDDQESNRLIKTTLLAFSSIWLEVDIASSSGSSCDSPHSIDWFVREILRRTKTTSSTLQLALLYLHRSRHEIRRILTYIMNRCFGYDYMTVMRSAYYIKNDRADLAEHTCEDLHRMASLCDFTTLAKLEPTATSYEPAFRVLYPTPQTTPCGPAVYPKQDVSLASVDAYAASSHTVSDPSQELLSPCSTFYESEADSPRSTISNATTVLSSITAEANHQREKTRHVLEDSLVQLGKESQSPRRDGKAPSRNEAKAPYIIHEHDSLISLSAPGDISLNVPSDFMFSFRCGRRVLLGLLLVASKVNQDRHYNNDVWAKMAGIPLPQINAIERNILKLLDYQLMVPSDVFNDWVHRLHSL